MRFLDQTLESPEENLTLDQLLFEQPAGHESHDDILRIWQPSTYFAVLGRGSKTAQEVNQAACERDGVPILRRTSGGAAVLCGPGCLMYSLILRKQRFPRVATIEGAHEFVLERNCKGLQSRGCTIRRDGCSDLVQDTLDGPRKVSGNSLRFGRDRVLYHGTLLYGFDIPRIATYLRHPPREPSYRRRRDHVAFLMNLTATENELRQALVQVWLSE